VTVPHEMRAVVWRGPGQPLAEELVPTPQLHGDDEVLVRVRTAVFGAALVRAVSVGHPKMTPPAVLGTLIAGDVVRAGSAVPHVRPGMRVTVDPHPPCGTCASCAARLEALCSAKRRVDPGAFATYVRVPGALARHLHVLPDALSYGDGAFCEIVACVLEATLVGDVTFGDTVCIVGCGPVALIQIQLARLRGATRVICLSTRPDRHALITHLGGEPIDVCAQPAVEAVRERTGGRGADVVFEMVGRSETYAQALELVRPGGTVVGFGGCPPGTTVSIDPNLIHYNGIRLVGSYHYAPGTFARALALLADRSVDLSGILSDRIPMSLVGEAVARVKRPGCITLLVEP
jgi:L-iditol 2-dehydrogenase